MATKYILAHDFGTSGDKASLFTTDGKFIGTPQPLILPIRWPMAAWSRIPTTGGQLSVKAPGN